MAKNPRLIDLAGSRLGLWTVIRQAGNEPRGGALWLCRCDCGTERVARGGDLRSGNSASCGCVGVMRAATLNRTHGASGTRLHLTWKNMLGRCRNPRRPGYQNYGGRGIAVCQEWGRFPAFRDWAIASGYADNLTIERIDVNGDYCPGNCTWEPRNRQSANRRFVQRAPDGELWWHKARRNGITLGAYRSRLYEGWPIKEAATRPMRIRGQAAQ